MKDDWAICVGIGAYPPKLKSLPGAIYDAQQLHQWLVDPTGGAVPAEQAALFDTPATFHVDDPRPTSLEIEAWFRRLFDKGRRSASANRGFRVGRRLWIHYAGHGMDLSGQETVLFTADAEFPDTYVHVAGRFYADYFLNRGIFEEVILVMDCCRNRQATMRAQTQPWPILNVAAGRTRYLHIFACEEGTAAREMAFDGQPQGLLTRVLLEALRAPRATALTQRDLADAVCLGVPKLRAGGSGPEVAFDPNVTRLFDIIPAPDLEPAHGLEAFGGPRPRGMRRDAEPGAAVPPVQSAFDAARGSAPIVAREQLYLFLVGLESDAACVETLPAGRLSLALRVPASSGVVLTVPTADAWRTEVYVDARECADGASPRISIRMVPSSQPPGSDAPHDRAREALVAALACGDHRAAQLIFDGHGDVSAVDPVFALLLAPHLMPVVDFTSLAPILGADDPDVGILRGDPRLAVPPLCARLWRDAVGRTEVVEGSLADRITGRLYAGEPWLTWSETDTPGSFMRSLAGTLWPGWDHAPHELAPRLVGDRDALVRTLQATEASIRRHAHKAPPVEQLERCDEATFAGASNDQLGPALVVAFVGRERKKWERLDLWFLSDAQLELVVSGQRRGARLRRDRDRARAELERLLPLVADIWHIREYDGLHVDGQWCFASQWGPPGPGGYVHLSPYTPGTDVRVQPAQYEDWPADAPAPPLFETVRSAIAATPTRVLARSR